MDARERVRQLRHLLQARETLVGVRTRLKNPGHAALTGNGIRFRVRLLLPPLPQSGYSNAMTYQRQPG
jgi:hypothetical protein